MVQRVSRLLFRAHAVRRMFERGISVDDVLRAVHSGEEIQEHAADQPHPSRLVLGWCGSRPLHVVVTESGDGDVVVITAYEPDPLLWDAGLRRRRR